MPRLDYTVIDGSNTPRIFAGEDFGNVIAPWRVDPLTQLKLGETNSVAAANPTADAALNSVLKGFWTGFNTRIPVVGQKLGAASIPVVLASDQTFSTPQYGNPTNLAIVAGQAITDSTGVFISIPTLTKFRIQINNIGAANLNGLEISTRCHASADMQTHLNTSAHFTAPPSNSILRLSGDTLGNSIDPTVLAATVGKVILAFDFRDFFVETIRIRASAAAATTLQFFHGGI